MDLKEAYENNTSVRSLAELHSCSKITIRRKLRKLGIVFQSVDNTPKYIDYLPMLEILEGELLGDGCVNPSSKSSARFRYNTSSKEYSAWLKELMISKGMEFGPDYEYNGCVESKSMSYRSFIPLYNKWYVNKIKIIPEDFKLTPVNLMHWYIGDGYLKRIQHRGMLSKYKYPCLATMCFDKRSIQVLFREFEKIGILFKEYSVGGGKCLIIKRIDDIPKFFDYIQTLPSELTDVYGYKWNWVNEDRNL